MIARTWHGVVRAENAAEYLKYLEDTGLSEYKNTPGNKGVQVLQRTANGETHFLLISLWESYDAIKAFAGEDYEKSHYYPEDEAFLLELEPFVYHYEWHEF